MTNIVHPVDTALPQVDTKHTLTTATLAAIIQRAVFKSTQDDKALRRIGAGLAAKDVALDIAAVLQKIDRKFDRSRWLRECGVR